MNKDLLGYLREGTTMDRLAEQLRKEHEINLVIRSVFISLMILSPLIVLGVLTLLR